MNAMESAVSDGSSAQLIETGEVGIDSSCHAKSNMPNAVVIKRKCGTKLVDLLFLVRLALH